MHFIPKTMQAIGHGSDSVMYFQWRQSRGGQDEVLHGAVVSTGQGDTSKVFRDVTETGAALETLRELVGSDHVFRSCAGVRLGKPLERLMVRVDLSKVTRSISKPASRPLHTVLGGWRQRRCNQSRVQLLGIQAPDRAYALPPVKPGTADRLRAFVESGGILLGTYLSGWVDENDLVFEKGIFSPLEELFGIRSEELDALYPHHDPRVVLPRGTHFGVEGSFEVIDFAERIHVIDAEVVGSYGKFWF